jgi:acyl-CoA dehydrogenase
MDVSTAPTAAIWALADKLNMDFSLPFETQAFAQTLQAFIDRYVLPYNPAWHQAVAQGEYPPAFMEDLKALAKEEGLWNLCLPELKDDEPGTRLSHSAYAPLAEIMGKLPWSAEVFNCQAPDSGNMALLHQFGSAPQKIRWLKPLLAGDIRSAFAMSEPDVASSDPTNLQTTVRDDGDAWVLNGRKWFITGAAHPHCKLLMVMCRNELAMSSDALVPEAHAKHHQHSIVLVPVETPGVDMVRNIPVVHHVAPEGHCEIVFKQVRVPKDALLGAWGEGFAMGQARLGPGRVHHCMRTLGQCELALSLAAERCLEREAFGHHLSDYASVQEWLALSRIEIDQARLLVMQVAWLLDQVDTNRSELLAKVAAIKVVAARLQVKVVDRAMQIFGAMGLSPDTPLAYFWTWGRALQLMDGPDEVHLRTVARQELAHARERLGAWSNYFTTPAQMARPPHIR